MAWFDRADAAIPDELRNLSKDEILAAVKFQKENTPRIAQLEGDLNTARQNLSNMETQFSDTKDRLTALEQQLAVRQQDDQKPAPVAQPQKLTDFYEDADRAFGERAMPIVNYTMETKADLALLKFERWLVNNPGKYGDNLKVYRKYLPEIEELMKNEPLQVRANPKAWENAFKMVKGIHTDEIVEARTTDKMAEFFGETSATAGAASVQELVPKDEITKSDRENAAKWGVSAEEMQKSRAGIQVYGEERRI